MSWRFRRDPLVRRRLIVVQYRPGVQRRSPPLLSKSNPPAAGVVVTEAARARRGRSPPRVGREMHGQPAVLAERSAGRVGRVEIAAPKHPDPSRVLVKESNLHRVAIRIDCSFASSIRMSMWPNGTRRAMAARSSGARYCGSSSPSRRRYADAQWRFMALVTRRPPGRRTSASTRRSVSSCASSRNSARPVQVMKSAPDG